MTASTQEQAKPAAEDSPPTAATTPESAIQVPTVVEVGGPSGLEPTRYGDWEKNGRCIDF